jgi:hypothetical protein
MTMELFLRDGKLYYRTAKGDVFVLNGLRNEIIRNPFNYLVHSAVCDATDTFNLIASTEVIADLVESLEAASEVGF